MHSDINLWGIAYIAGYVLSDTLPVAEDVIQHNPLAQSNW